MSDLTRRIDAIIGRLPERLSSKIAVDPLTGCWQWITAMEGKSYAYLRWNGQRTGVHRIVYELLIGPIPDGLVLDHLCRMPRCVNPDHLEPVTTRINILRGESPSARSAVVTHCPQNHAYNETNTYVSPDGDRHCRVCQKIRARQRRREGRA